MHAPASTSALVLGSRLQSSWLHTCQPKQSTDMPFKINLHACGAFFFFEGPVVFLCNLHNSRLLSIPFCSGSPLFYRFGIHCVGFLYGAGVGIRIVLRVLYMMGRPSTKHLQPLSSVLFPSILVSFSQHPFLPKRIVLFWAMLYICWWYLNLYKDDTNQWKQCR